VLRIKKINTMYRLSQIAEVTNTRFQGEKDHEIRHFLNDSRSLISAEGVLFIALKTSRNDGHRYIPDLIARGLRSFLVMEGELDLAAYQAEGISFLVSADPLEAIQRLAAYHRSRFSVPVIGITGSNGKTVVKEWLYQLLKEDYSICRSPKSYNSQIGVPLSLLNLDASHTLGLFEAGISQPGEMDRLVAMIRPDLGVFTAIGSAHDEGFASRTEKLGEKLKLLAYSRSSVVSGLEKGQAPGIKQDQACFVSEFPDADLRIRYSDHTLSLSGEKFSGSFQIPFSDGASVSNVATCVAVLLELGFSGEEIASRLLQLQPVALRLELKKGIGNSRIINDYYNSDLDSLRIALNYLQQQNLNQKRVVVVSDIEQSGLPAGELYRQVASLLKAYQVDLLVGIGKDISAHRDLFQPGSLFFENTPGFIARFRDLAPLFSEAGVLLKGARSFGFETISRLLQMKSHDTVFEINLNKLINNVNYYRSLLAPRVKLMGMVKAMGYGSGGAEIARTLQHIGVNYLAVAYADEGVELRLSQIHLPVMVMNPEEDAFEDIINYRLEPEIYHFGVMRAFASKLDAMGITEPYPVHLKIDTGMHRLGFEEQELEALVEALKQLPRLKVQSVFSHLAGADNPGLDAFTAGQIRIFEKAFRLIEQELGYPVMKHLCNSGGITRFPGAHYDMVRLGIGMYGLGVSAEEQNRLENVGSLRTRISQIRSVAKGETVGYNRNGKIEKDSRVATIPIGYADGYSRAFGNGRHGVYVRGEFCRTIGNICMDMCMIDVSEVDCREGDEVVIFENAGQIHDMAKALNSIAYEVLTNVSGRVKRIYVQE
jgi:alanine racemase